MTRRTRVEREFTHAAADHDESAGAAGRALRRGRQHAQQRHCAAQRAAGHGRARQRGQSVRLFPLAEGLLRLPPTSR